MAEHFTPQAISNAVNLAEAIAKLRNKVIIEYAVMNDPEVWAPLVAEGGKLGPENRFIVDNPIHTSLSLWTAYKFWKNYNEERARQGKADEYGLTILVKRQVVETPWTEVTGEEIDDVRR